MYTIENLYREYKLDVYAYLLSLTHNPTLSEDLLSDTFLTAIRVLPTFKQNSTVKTWLCGIARNMWLQHLRKLKPQVEYDDLMEVYITQSIENNFITKQTVNRIYELLETKDERTRKIVGMRVDGIAYSEIAEITGIRESSARVIDYRTKKWLKYVLEKEGLL